MTRYWWQKRLIIRRPSLWVTIMVTLMSLNLFAQADRRPANFIPNDEVAPIPIQQEVWIEEVMVEDDRGILKDMQKNLRKWQRAENFVEQWDADEELVRDYKSRRSQRKYLTNRLLKYFDRRVSGEIKHAEKGSTMAKVGQAQKALKPQTKVAVSKNIQLKFKIRLLRGRAYMDIKNPYVKSQMVMTFGGKTQMEVKKKFKEQDFEARAEYKVNENKLALTAEKGYERIGATAKVNYNVTTGRWVASVSKQIVPHVTATVSSSQKLSDFDKESVRVAKLQYYLSF